MKIITKSNRTRLLIGILLALLLMALFAAVFPWLRTRIEPLFLPDENSPQMAAKRGAEIFYSLDYRQKPEEWVEALCAISTEGGCALAELAAPNLWEALEGAKTRTQAKVEVVAQVRSNDIAGFSEIPTEVWELHITLSEPLPGPDHRAGPTLAADRFAGSAQTAGRGAGLGEARCGYPRHSQHPAGGLHLLHDQAHL